MLSVERPFGVHLYPYLNTIFQPVVRSPAIKFDFVAGGTPMSTLGEMWFSIIIYYAIVFGGQAFMRNREPVKIDSYMPIHNLILSVASALLLLLYIEEILPTIARNGMFYAICDPDGGWTKRLVVLYYVSLPGPKSDWYIHFEGADRQRPTT